MSADRHFLSCQNFRKELSSRKSSAVFAQGMHPKPTRCIVPVPTGHVDVPLGCGQPLFARRFH